MAKSDIKRMIEIGQWIEGYLKATATSWDFLNLARSFVDLYNIDYGVTKNDITIAIARMIEEQPKEIQDYYKINLTAAHSVVGRDIYQKKDPLKIYRVAEKISEECIVFDEDRECFLTPVLPCLNDLYSYREYLQYSFKKIMEFKQPWQVSLMTLSKEQTIFTKRDENNKIIEINKPKTLPIIFSLRHNYKKIHTTIYENKDNQTFTRLKQFTVNGVFTRKDRIKQYPCENIVPSNFPWKIAASRAFFDFLFLGGQDYYGFCEWCGNFFVSKRKLKKIYCSDNCRASHRNQINREKAAAKN